VSFVSWTMQVVNNVLWEPDGQAAKIQIGGVGYLLIANNMATHSDDPVLRLRAKCGVIAMSGNVNGYGQETSGGGGRLITTVGGVPSVVGSAVGSARLSIGGNNATSPGIPIADLNNVDDVFLVSAPDKTVLDVNTTPPLDATTVIQIFRTTNINLWGGDSTTINIGKRYKIINRTTAQITVVAPSGGVIKNLSGSLVGSIPIPIRGFAEVIYSGAKIWEQIQ